MKLSYCVIAAIFIGASIYTMLTCETCSPFTDFLESLTPEQKVKYTQIIQERQRLYVHGLVLGSIVSLLYLYFATGTFNPLTNVCAFVAIALAVQYFYYTLTPKSQWIITSLDKEDQRQKWLNVYTHMKTRYHVGMLLGLIGYGLFAFSTQ